MRGVLDSPAIETASSCASLQTYDRLRSGTLAEYSRLLTDFQRPQKTASARGWRAVAVIVPTLCVGMLQGTLLVQ
ncbi:hypothetical protein PspS49_07665 [Pseudomonas sp. S49]|nr:hypothetical protein PspS49_07665 [Pseudomonas sp. S49]